MVEYVQQEVRDLEEDPVPGERVELLLGVGGPMGSVKRDVESLGGTVLEELPFDTLRVAVRQTALGQLCELDGIESVEIEGSGETLTRGN